MQLNCNYFASTNSISIESYSIDMKTNKILGLETHKQKGKILALKKEIERLENMPNKDEFYIGLLLAYKENFKEVLN